MRILLTGASSFTGYWFAKTIAEKGHQLTLTFTKDRTAYTGLRGQRVELLQKLSGVTCLWNYSFGTEEFLDLLDQKFDTVCHHGAYVEDYKSPSFDVGRAVAENANHCPEFMARAKRAGLKKIILTGSVFEANEGNGSDPLVAFSPYGLSKTFTWETFRYWAWKYDIPLTKFVIPNPFGPYEEPRFCNYLVQNWAKSIIPSVKTPDYVRDNIHVELLACCYVLAIEKEEKGITTVNPSGYATTQKEFTQKFALEIGKRLGIGHEVKFDVQDNFDEPLARINTSPAVDMCSTWNEEKAWDQLADYYKQMLSLK
jgi:UDP-glucose 4-epimerase